MLLAVFIVLFSFCIICRWQYSQNTFFKQNKILHYLPLPRYLASSMYPDTIIMCSSDYHIPDADRKTIANARAWFSRCARNPHTTRTHSSYTINISYILYNGVDGRKYRQTIIAQTHTHTQSIFCWMEKRKQNAKMRNGTIHQKFNEKLCVREQRQKKY